MSIYITGSLAYDRIMKFSGKFNDSILSDHLDILSVSFFIDDLEEKLGGVAGNIAHTLALMGELPVIVATAGKDFELYEKALKERGLPLQGVNIQEDSLTASCYLIVDNNNNQITAFHAAAHKKPSTYDFSELKQDDFAIIGATNPQDMIAHPQVFKKRGIRYIFDPSQQLPVFPAKQLPSCIEGAYLLIGNEYEINLIGEMTGKSFDDLVAMTTRGVIVTKGEHGSLVVEKNSKPVTIPAVSVSAIADPTGAGDSYRSGLLKGLAANISLPQCAALGATCAAYCVEVNGTQVHNFTQESFKERYEKTFGTGSFPSEISF